MRYTLNSLAHPPVTRRDFLALAGALALAPASAFAAERTLRFADMHSHAGILRRIDSMRAAMVANGMLVVARKIVADGPVIRTFKGRLGVFREARPGELAKNFDDRLARLHEDHQREELIEIVAVEDLDRAVATRAPGVVIAAEGGDFLEGNLQRLESAHKAGLAHLQLVHYRVSEIGDISTEAPRYQGLSQFGREVVEACRPAGRQLHPGAAPGAGCLTLICARQVMMSCQSRPPHSP